MTEQAERSQNRPPGRRSMLWRLVRPTRRRICVGLLVLLLAVLGGYFHFTSDSRVRAVVEAELTRQLGRPVRVGGASFSLFGPIEIRDLDIPSKTAGRPSELTAEKIIIHHEVLAMLRGHFQPTRVACDGLVVTVDVDLAPEGPDQPPGDEKEKSKPIKPPDFDLPTVTLRGGKLRLIYHDGPRHVETVETSLAAELKPLGEKKYDFRAEASLAGGGGFDLSAVVNTVRGELDELSVPIEFVERLLPPELRKQVGQYALSGSLNVTRRIVPAPEARVYVVDLAGLAATLPKSLIPLNVAGLEGRVVINTTDERIALEEVSCAIPKLGRGAMLALSGSYDWSKDDSRCQVRGVLEQCELPAKLGSGLVEETLAFIRKYYDPRGSFDVAIGYNWASGEEGKLSGSVTMGGHVSGQCLYFPYRLEGVTGRVDFTADKITRIDLAGTHGKATAKIVGDVSDMGGDGLYDISISAWDVALDAGMKHALDESVGEFLWRDLQPRGQANTVVKVSRTSHKEGFRIKVTLPLDGRAGITHAAFPYALDKIRGKVVIDGKAVRITDATGVHGSAECTVNGAVTKIDTANPVTDLTVDIKTMLLDKAFLSAIGEDGAKALRDLGAAGTVRSARTHVMYRADGTLDYLVRADLGNVRIKPDIFPYELTEVSGPIEVTPRHVVLINTRGRHGKSGVEVEGEFLLTGKDAGIERLTVKAERLVLDADLRAALGPEVGEVWGDLALGGLVEDVQARLWHKNPAKPDALDYVIHARLAKVQARPKLFPYDLTDIAGFVSITPRDVTLDNLTGRHDESRITLQKGNILLTDKDAAIESLVFKASRVALDDDLRVALGPEMDGIWRDLAPRGMVDIPRGILRHKDPAKPDVLDYDIAIEPLGASVTYADFPRTVTGITGGIHAVPGRVTLVRLKAVEGKTRVDLNGEIDTGKNTGAELVLTARDVPVDKRLIAAMGKVAPKGVKHIKPGGSISVQLDKLCFGSRCPAGKDATTRKAPGPKAPAPKAPAPTAPQPWSVTGKVSFKDMGVDVGLGSKTLSGSFAGSGSGLGEQLEMDAKLALDEVLVQTRRITALRGQLLKKRDGTMLQIRNFNAWSYGGQLDGKAEIDLGDPIKYGIDLVVHRIKLAEMAALGGLGPAAAKDAKKVKGLLSGRITMLAVNGDATKQQGSGKIHITDANISKLPILLELLHLVQLQLPGNTSFTEADVIYRLSGQKLIFQEIYLQSSVISFVGSGTLDLKSSKIRLTFVGGRVGKLPRLKKLIGLGPADIIKLLAKQIVEIRTTGTLEKPKTETIPLPGLPNFNKLLRVLLRPPPIEDDAP